MRPIVRLSACATMAGLLAAGCPDPYAMMSNDGDAPLGTSGAPATSTTATSTSDAASSGSVDLDTSMPGSSGAASTDDGMGFVPRVDTWSASECDLFTQDCPPGQKCMPYANDGGPAWNATRCSEIARDPAQLGEPCTVRGSAVSGIDDCDIGLMCWYVDENGEGICEDMCTGSPDNPLCDDPNDYCPISGSGVITLCLPHCDPLVQNCPIERFVCYPFNDGWGCAPDASGDEGTYGDPCEYINACDPFHACIGAAAFSDCTGGVGCCTIVCDTSDPEADAMCAALDPGQSCEGWWIEGMAPPGYENVGVCALPP